MKLKTLSLILTYVLILSLMTSLSFLTVYAVEDDDPRISFDANGGSMSVGSKTVFYGVEYGVNYGALPIPERTARVPLKRFLRKSSRAESSCRRCWMRLWCKNNQTNGGVITDSTSPTLPHG